MVMPNGPVEMIKDRARVDSLARRAEGMQGKLMNNQFLIFHYKQTHTQRELETAAGCG